MSEKFFESKIAAGEKNIYSKERFKPEEAKEQVEVAVTGMKEHFAQAGYQDHEPVRISSGIDPTVRFIGSHISVFKPYLLEGTIPEAGYSMRQNCIRTRNSKSLFDDAVMPNWGSYFPSFGAVVAPGKLASLSQETLRLFTDTFKIDKSRIKLLVSSGDKDLMDVCEALGGQQVEIDTKPANYYRHKIGIDGVSGRNFNIALQNADGNGFADIGNIIVLEQDGKELGVEAALGVTTILKQLHGLEHVLDCHPAIGLTVGDQKLYRKFQDAMLVSTALSREGLVPGANSNRERIYRTYVRSLSYFRSKGRVSINKLEQLLGRFEEREFPDTPPVGYVSIMEYLRTYEDELKTKKNLSPEDEVILQALNG